MPEVMIEVEGLTKFYGEHLAVDGISFQVKKGEVVGFLGPNGSGKTTTMRILTGYLPPSTGTASIAGFDTMTASLDARRHIGYLPETVPLYTDMTVEDYLRFLGTIRGMRKDQLKRRIDTAIERVKLGDYRKSFISKLSKGYRQRTGLAQAILHEPEVLILDEPTVGIDPIQVVETRQLIKELGKEQTLLLSTHILPEVSATCDRVIIINQGSIVAEDTPDNLAVRLRGSEQVQAEIRGPSADVIKAIRDLSGVTSARHIETATGSRYNIESSAGNDIREKVAEMVVTNSWGLLQLSVVPMSLEEIFLELTSGEENEDA
jgi:ABC-2 type transport system ATP-binding protein